MLAMIESVEGKVYPEVVFAVDPARVAAFRRVFGLVAGVPPTFATAAEFDALPQIIADPELGMDFAQVVHGSQSYVHHRPLAEGEALKVRSRLESVRSKGGNRLITIVTELVGTDGEIACTARSTLIERGAGR